VWLAFRGYDFDANPLGIPGEACAMVQRQYERISAIRHADTWGVDFHKGAGGCPIDCSFVMARERSDLSRLSKAGNPMTDMHQLADEFSYHSPCDYTLETSRAGGKALAALTALHTMGRDGYRGLVGDLIQGTALLRRQLQRSPDIAVLNGYALGYQTMVRLYPPEHRDDPRRGRELADASPALREFIVEGNRYLKAFFTWDNDTRMEVNGGGMLYSFSSKFVTTPSEASISGLKFYPVSPRLDSRHVHCAVETLRRRKDEFDAQLWSATPH
jgi:hypothetical protein